MKCPTCGNEARGLAQAVVGMRKPDPAQVIAAARMVVRGLALPPDVDAVATLRAALDQYDEESK